MTFKQRWAALMKESAPPLDSRMRRGGGNGYEARSEVPAHVREFDGTLTR